MGAMGSVQEDPERNSDSGHTEEGATREESEEKEVWWMTEEHGGEEASADVTGAADHSEQSGTRTGADERLREEWERKERGMDGEGREGWRRVMEAKERAWMEERQKMEEEHRAEVESLRQLDEERIVEVDMLKARVLELEVVSTMAKWASVGVQATNEDEDSESRRRIAEAEEKLASVCQENEQLKSALEQMRIASREDRRECLHCDLCSKQMEGVCASEAKPSATHEDDLRREYESQIRNVRELRGMYEERMKAAEEQCRKLREDLQERTRRLELCRRRCSELRAHSQELEALVGEQEGVARGLEARLSASLEEGRTLAAQLATVNKLFGRLGDTAELDFERLRLLQRSCEGGAPGEDSGDCASHSESGGKETDAGRPEEAAELKEIAVSLPKVWRLLVELLGEEQEEEERASEEPEECFDRIPTPYGPRLVISVSRTFIRLKDLILEKKSLQGELCKIRDLNGRLESKLKQQERRLAAVKVELKRTWGLVSRMRAQHRQLHTSEQVLRYELQQKRKLLGELKQELEYCREKWELARLKNSQSEKEWQLLRQEFTARRSVAPATESAEANSPESGFSDGRGEDEEEEAEGGDAGDAAAGLFGYSDDDSPEKEDAGLRDSQAEASLPLDEKGHALPLNLGAPYGECSSAAADSDPAVSGAREGEAVSDAPAVERPDAPPDAGDVAARESVPEGSAAAVAPAERSMEERLRARAERLRRLEEQCSLLFRKVTRTTTRSEELSNRLEELHEQYGEGGGEARREAPPRDATAAGTSSTRSRGAPSRRPPTPPPLPDSLPVLRLPSLLPPSSTPAALSLPRPILTAEAAVASPLQTDDSSTAGAEIAGESADETSPEERNETVGAELPELATIPELEHLSDGDGNDSLLPVEESVSAAEEEESAETAANDVLPGVEAAESSASVLSDSLEADGELEVGSSGGEGSEAGEEAGEESERQSTEELDAYISDMSSTIYGLHHGPLFDEGNSPSSSEEEEEDEEECAEGLASGSIGVASLLLQQLPKRMDLLRQERHSLEQRLEEGEAALGRALAGTAAAERRARALERGLAQAQERLRVLEMEAAVERNERLLEIKSALDSNPEEGVSESDIAAGGGELREQSTGERLQEEIDNLQQQTLAQIAGLQAAAVVSRAQTEQLSDLSEEVERQERLVRCLERELSCLRRERGEQAEVLKDVHQRLDEAVSLLTKKQEENEALQLQFEELKRELSQSNKENVELKSRAAAAEAEVIRLNNEIAQLKNDCDCFREAVIRLTGEKEDLYRMNHSLEEMRRLVLEDPQWAADRENERCTACDVVFSLMVRRHHCRSCGRIFCGACSSHWLTLNPMHQSSSLVAGVVSSLMGAAVAGRRSRACADCFAAYSRDGSKTDSPNSPERGLSPPEDSADAGASGEAAEGGEGDDEDNTEDFSMISEEEVVLSQCTPYVPNPRTLQYWKSCEIQSGVMITLPDLLRACLPEGGVPGKGKEEEVWVRAGAIYSVPILVEDTSINVFWEFSTNPNSIAFSVLYKSGADIPMSCALIVVPTTRVNSHLNPVHGRLRPKRAGVYVLMFDNSFSRFTGKTISYCMRAEASSSGRDSIASSSRSSVEPFPDLPVHQEGTESSLEHDEDGIVQGSKSNT